MDVKLDPKSLSGQSPDEVLQTITDAVAADGLTLYPHQLEAALAILSDNHTIVTTPTGSGKTLIATIAQAACLARGGRSWYTAPIKALVSEKFFGLVEVFGAGNVGMITGDVSVNDQAPIIVCTTEILANLALRQGREAPVDQVVADEFHYIADPDRGWAWQVVLSELPQAQHILMSATLGDLTRTIGLLDELTERETTVISGVTRPVPLEYSWATDPIHETVQRLVRDGQAPVYVVHATQRMAFDRAQGLLSIPLLDTEAKNELAEAIKGFTFAKGFGTLLEKLVRHGVGVHHAGMLPRYRRIVEQLAQRGLLKVICGTDTLGVGINVPIRTVLFNALTKFDGRRQRVLKAREFHQIAGRAGRAGHDTIGYVVVQAPEHSIENARAEAKAGDDPKKRKKLVKKRPPDGFVNWTEETFERLVNAQPEPLTGRMQVTHAMILNLLERDQDTVVALRAIIDHAITEPGGRRTLYRRALMLGRSMRESGTVVKLDRPTPGGRQYELNPQLQADFALNQPLAPFAVEMIAALDPSDPDHALNLISIIEATLEDPMQVLLAQQHRARGEAIAEMKADGMDYNERMKLVDEVAWPKPLEADLEAAFAIFQPHHPWVSQAALSPKSIAREMAEHGMGFASFVQQLKLEKSEGIVLRYLSDAYRALRQTVPESARNDDFEVMLDWLDQVIVATDSSLVDEWEALMAGGGQRSVRARTVEPPRFTSNTRALEILVRNALWQRVRLAADDNVEALEALEPGNERFTGDDWDEALADYWDEHDEIVLDADARSPKRVLIDRANPRRWVVRQIISDPEGDHDWQLHAVVDLDASDQAESLVLTTLAFGRLDA